MTKIRIRRAKGQDCDALLALIHDHAAFEQSMASIEGNELAHIIGNPEPPVQIFVAEGGNEILGYAAVTNDYSLWRGRCWAHLDCLFVKSQARGLGIGGQLLRHIASVALASGADRLEWQTPDWNERAASFYRAHGAKSAKKLRFGIALNEDRNVC